MLLNFPVIAEMMHAAETEMGGGGTKTFKQHLNRNPYRISHAYLFSASFKFPVILLLDKMAFIIAISFTPS